MSLWTVTTLASRYLLEPPGKLGRAAGSWQKETLAMGQPLYRGHLMCQVVGVPLLSPSTLWRQLSSVRIQEGRQKGKASARLEFVCSMSAPGICDCGTHTHAHTLLSLYKLLSTLPHLSSFCSRMTLAFWGPHTKETAFSIKIQPAPHLFFPTREPSMAGSKPS